MKNTNLKLNKTKLVARLMVVVVLVVSTTILSSCFSIGGETSCVFTFYSHEEFAEFIEEYVSNKQDRFVPTFVSFDLDDIDYIKVDKYSVGTSQKRSKNILTGEVELESVYDATHNDGFGYTMTFFMDDYLENGEKVENAYKITCTFLTKAEYNFYQNDTMRIEYLKLNDLKYKGWFCVNDIREIEFSIDCARETSQERIDEITQLLMDNIAIINAED